MKIKKTIELQVEKKGKYIICNDLPTLCLVCGTKGISGNYHLYNIQKKDNKFFVDIDFLKKRIKLLEERVKRTSDALDIMKQVVMS